MTLQIEPLEVIYIGTDNEDMLEAVSDYCFAEGNGNHILNIEDALFALEIKEEDEDLSQDEYDLLLALRTAQRSYPNAGDAIIYRIFDNMRWVHPQVREDE